MPEQNSFITNERDYVMSDVINGILPKCNAVDMLVGYFYFSGYSELCDKLIDKKIRILVGMEIDMLISGQVREIYSLDNGQRSRQEIRDNYYASLRKVINDSNFLDTEENQRKFRIFVDKIMDGSLEIRKTLDPCHAKLYLFQYSDELNEGGNDPGAVITGSSNLSFEGLTGRREINVRLNDKQHFIDGKKIFEELWQDAILISDQEKFRTEIIETIWIDKDFSPYLMYLRVLDEYFNVPSRDNVLTPFDITNGKFRNLKYQTDAIQMSLNTIQEHNGVIISDVVGLGKSVIASTIARNLHLKTIIICPPHLDPQWNEYKDEFGVAATVFSGGKISEALTHYYNIALNEQILVIIDEAHRYRNEFTEDYSLLHELCSGNKVVLLTATPFNNDPSDIYAMVKLFQLPNKSTLNTVENLGTTFRELIKRYSELRKAQREGAINDETLSKDIELISKHIRSIINPLIIRRSRLDLEAIPAYKQDLETQGIKPLIPEDPILLDYPLGDLQDLYLSTLEKINPSHDMDDGQAYFRATRYTPIQYVIPEKEKELAEKLEKETGVDYYLLIGRQANISQFMRRMLVSRFESSIEAFRTSLINMIRYSQNMLEWVNRRDKVPIYKKGNLPSVNDFYESTQDGDIEIEETFEKYTNRGFFEIDCKYLNKEDFLKDLQSDINVLEGIRQEWFGDDNKIKSDPKLESFKKIVRHQIEKDPKRKLVVFTEFADTANYLGEALKDEDYGVFKYTSGDASPNNKNTIRLNFDAGLEKILQRDDYHVLIATDAISEGYNLHRAGAIFNYDIPYNPTRVIQRIGRINRINKKVFDKLYIYNYFPTDVGESETRVKEISTLKMAMIHAILGEDTKALTSEEELQSFFKDTYRKEMAKSEAESWYTKFKRQLDEAKSTDAYKQAMQIPHRARIGRQVAKTKHGVILFGKKGNDFIFKISQNAISIPEVLPAEDALELFKAEVDEPAVPLTSNFEPTYQEIKQSLFSRDVETANERDRRMAYDKINLIIERNLVDNDYMQDLLCVLENDALSGYEVRLINKLKRDDYVNLPQYIHASYLKRILHTANEVDKGDETLILSEELQ